MTSMAVSEREVSDILRRVIHLEEGVKEMRSDVRTLDAKIDGILSQIATVQGGMAVAIWAAGILGALGMFALTKVAPLLLGFLPKV